MANYFDKYDYPASDVTSDSSSSGNYFDKYEGQTVPQVNAHPVTGEVGDIVKAIPRQLLVGAGKLADLPGHIWDLAFHPEGEDNADIGTAVARKTADVTGLPKTGSGALSKDIGASIEAAPTAIFGGPEAIVPTMLSGAASQEAANQGFGPVGQFVAGLTPFAPSFMSAGIRAATRGGAGGAANTAENLANAKQAGMNISMGQASGNPVLQTAENISAKLPGGGPLANTRGTNLNVQAEESVSNIVNKIAPGYNQNPPTPTTAGEAITTGANKRIEALKEETEGAKKGMETAVGGKDTPMSAPNLEAILPKITGSTGIQDVDNLVTGAKTKAVAKTVKGVTEQPQISTSYSTDGEGYHFVGSPNGETHAVEDANGNLKVTRSDTSEAARGTGEGTARLESLANVATNKGKNLVSDISVSPAEAAAYEKLGRKGWQVTKNPNAEVNPATGNTISDSPKNPVYTVSAPKTSGTGQAQVPSGTEQQLTGEWTYNPKTGKSEPVVKSPDTSGPQPETKSASLNAPTPWTFDSLRQLRTTIGRGIKTTRDPGQQGQLKQLYGAISDDLTAGVQKIGPQAEQAYNLFNQIAKQNSGTQKVLTQAINKLGGPEQVFKAAVNGSKDGASKISPIMNALDPEGQNLFRATVLHRLGRAGGAVDAPFDANTFLTNYKAMSPEAKNVLFNTKSGWGSPGELRSSLDSLSNTLDLLKKQGFVTSGLTKAVAQGTGHGGGNVLKVLLYGWLGEHGVSAVSHLASGNPIGAAAAIGGGTATLAVNPIMSRALTNPKVIAWMARAGKAPAGMVPILLNQLNKMGNNDPDAKDLAGLIRQETNQ